MVSHTAVMLIGFHIGESQGPTVIQIGESHEIVRGPLQRVILVYTEILE